jgi:hypothetical protein
MTTLSTVNTTDTFETWRQKDNAAITLVNTHDTLITALQATLSAPSSITYYVSTTGNDSNDGSSSNPFLTLQAAIDKALKSNVDKGVTITISVSNGTYTAPFVISGSPSGSMVNGTTWQTPLIITGGSSAILTSANAASTMTIGPRAIVKIDGGLQIGAYGTTGTRHTISVQDGGVLEIGSVNFTGSVGSHINVSEHGMVLMRSNYTISGGGDRHILVSAGLLTSSGLTVTLTGTPAFTTAFLEATDTSFVQYSGHTFLGSSTGARFSISRGAYVRTGTVNLSYLPGTTGSITTGGAYEGLFTLGNLDNTVIGATTPAAATVTTMTVNSTLDVNGQQDLHNNNLKGVKTASMNGGGTTSGTTGAVTVNWVNGALITQNSLTGNPTFTFTAPINTNAWLQLMGVASANPYTITWPGNVIWYGSTFATTTANKAWVVRFFYDGTNYHAFGVSQV